MFDFGALELAGKIKNKEISVSESVRAYIDLIEKNDNNAFISVSREEALARAEIIQARINAGEFISSLAGVPIALKDNISTAGIRTTCASKMLENYVPVYNACVVDKLEQAGMIIVGKLNMDEFAMGGSSETGAFGAVRNPWDNMRVAGGSSGGSAAAVASGTVPVTLGSDTGGSIRQPCAFCGVTGIKPTYGAVSRYGLIAYASSLDQIGTVARDIDDCAAVLDIISGADSRDSTCVIDKAPHQSPLSQKGVSRSDGGFTPNLMLLSKSPAVATAPPFAKGGKGDNLNGIKIGLPRNYFDNGIDGGVKSVILEAVREFEAAGACICEFDMPLMDYMIPAYYIIACAEASSNLSRYDGLKYGYYAEQAETLAEVYNLSRSEGFGLEVKRRIMLGSFVLSSGYYDSYYKKALQTRALIKETYNKLFEKFDVIISPVAPTSAYKIGENISEPMKMYMGDIYTVSVNLAGLPAIALPCGFDESGLPVGLQIIGDAFTEEKLVQIARVYQRRTNHHKVKPGGVKL